VSAAFTHRHRVDVAAGSRLGAGLVVTAVATDGVVEAVRREQQRSECRCHHLSPTTGRAS
jgi:gamma-glutamyl-gamma-aminobutyrate hydrolase PuuD